MKLLKKFQSFFQQNLPEFSIGDISSASSRAENPLWAGTPSAKKSKKNWFHVKSEWQKNPEFSTLCVEMTELLQSRFLRQHCTLSKLTMPPICFFLKDGFYCVFGLFTLLFEIWLPSFIHFMLVTIAFVTKTRSNLI